MKSLYVSRYGGPGVLEVREEPDPLPGPHEVRIRVARAGLNFSDLMGRMGLYPDAPKPPAVLGYEVSGVVDAVGDAATLPEASQVVAFTRFRGQADCVCVPESLVQLMPRGMTFDQGAAMPVNYLTAYHALFHVARLRPHQKVLLHMAAGGVGHAAIQLMKTVTGVEIFGTASKAKHEHLRALGVQEPIDYHTQDYAQVVRERTHGRGVDLVLDPLGGHDWEKGYQLLAPMGQLIAYGWANLARGRRRNLLLAAKEYARMPRFTPFRLMGDNRTVSGLNIGHLWAEQATLRGHLGALMELFTAGKIQPLVDKVFPLSEGAAAHRYLHEHQNVGKVLFDCT